MIYAIYEDFYKEVEKKLNRISKKCVKHGNDFVFEVVSEEIREKFNTETKETEYYKFVLVEVSGTAKINDWECIAVIEHTENGNIIRKINTVMEVPERFRNSDNYCEHCNSKRQRKKLFVIHNVETDEWKQVGGSCLKLYTDGLSMEYVTAYMDGIITLEEQDGMFGFSSTRRFFPVEEVLQLSVEVVNKMGYFNNDNPVPTRWIVSELIYSNDINRAITKINSQLEYYRIDAQFNRNDFFYKKETKEQVENIINHYRNLDDDSEFVHNVKIFLKNGYVNSRDFGFICYLPDGYARYMHKQVEKAKRLERTENSKHFGEIGKRYKDKKIESVKCLTSWQTQYGVTSIYEIIIEDGYILTWKTSNYIEENPDSITFTVKEHKEYNGMNQTEVTRCKIAYSE